MKINDSFIIIITDENIKNKNLTIKTSENQMSDKVTEWDELITFMRRNYE